jgi:hypothetical protein
MPKYYVVDELAEFNYPTGPRSRAIVNASNPQMACVLAMHQFFSTSMVNGHYRVSERGFEDHLDDYIIDSNQVNKLYLELLDNQYPFPPTGKQND